MTAFHDLAAAPDPDDPLEEQALAVLQQLRPELDSDKWALVRTDDVGQRPTFTVAVDDDGAVGAVAGWRVLAMTSVGRTLYVDDLCTDAAVRSRGQGKALLDHLMARAAELGASSLSLDSGTPRHDAHRFYLRERMSIVSFHFARPVQ